MVMVYEYMISRPSATEDAWFSGDVVLGESLDLGVQTVDGSGIGVEPPGDAERADWCSLLQRIWGSRGQRERCHGPEGNERREMHVGGVKERQAARKREDSERCIKHQQARSKMQEQGKDKVVPEERLIQAMIAGPCMPISLFWMGWTSDSNISLWSPLVASVLFGFSVMGIFISCYQYIIDSYEGMAASALVGMTLSRYCVVSIDPDIHGVRVHLLTNLI